jgi:hypothetical protein
MLPRLSARELYAGQIHATKHEHQDHDALQQEERLAVLLADPGEAAAFGFGGERSTAEIGKRPPLRGEERFDFVLGNAFKLRIELADGAAGTQTAEHHYL